MPQGSPSGPAFSLPCNRLSPHQDCQPQCSPELRSEGLAFRVARPALLARCLEDGDVDVAAVQETRCEQGTLRAGLIIVSVQEPRRVSMALSCGFERVALSCAAESVALVLCPACVADTAKPTPAKQLPLLPEILVWSMPGPLPRVLTGEPANFALECPPSPLFCYPFDSPVTISLADSTAGWLTKSTATLLEACRCVAERPVRLYAGDEAQQVLGPAWGWVVSSGFVFSKGSRKSAC